MNRVVMDFPVDVIATGGCVYCEREAPVRLKLNDAPAEDVPNRLDAIVTSRCACLGDVLFGIGHRASQRKRVREAIEECPSGYVERHAALLEAARKLALPRDQFAGFSRASAIAIER